MFSHTKLLIWQRAMDIVQEIYELTKVFPEEEKFGMVSQMRRSAVSIASNIAEGSYRSTKKDFSSFLATARGSLGELQRQCSCALSVNILKKENIQNIEKLLDNEMNMLNAFIRNLKK